MVSQKEVAVLQFSDGVKPQAVTHEYAAALKNYCAVMASLNDQVHGGQDLSMDEIDDLEAAKLRLENARTLCELYVGCALDPADRPHVHRLYDY